MVGAVLLIGGFLSPLLTPLVISANLPGTWKTVITTGLVVGIPEVAMFAAVAVLGKQGYQQLKNWLFSIFKKHVVPSAVSKTRYRVGLLMFTLPLILGWTAPYAAHISPVIAGVLDKYRLLAAFIPDLIFISSFLVLGAGFWDKVRGLFIYMPNEHKAK